MDTTTEASQPSVQELLVRVMQDVEVITKDDRNAAQGYQFRGVDATMNTVGPILRKHGLVCVPVSMSVLVDKDVPTQRNTMMRGVTVRVRWAFMGPAGDTLTVETLGEANDSGDKAIPKATSVAYRELWLKTLCVPTQDPTEDVDKSPSPERAVPGVQRQVDPATAVKLEKEIAGRRSESGYRESWANVTTAYECGELSTEDRDRLTSSISDLVQRMRASASAVTKAEAEMGKNVQREEMETETTERADS